MSPTKDEEQTSEEPSVEPGRYEEPREKADPAHRDAGQVAKERQDREREDDDASV